MKAIIGLTVENSKEALNIEAPPSYVSEGDIESRGMLVGLFSLLVSSIICILLFS